MTLKEIDKALAALTKHITTTQRLNREGLKSKLAVIRAGLKPHRELLDEEARSEDKLDVLRDARRFRGLVSYAVNAEDFDPIDGVQLVLPDGAPLLFDLICAEVDHQLDDMGY